MNNPKRVSYLFFLVTVAVTLKIENTDKLSLLKGNVNTN